MKGYFDRSLTQWRDRLSALQIVIAVLSVSLAGGASSWALAFAFLASLWAFWRPLPSSPSPSSQRAWTGAVAIALVLSIARGLFWSELLDAGVDFLLLLVVQRFFNRQRSREHRQLLLLGVVFMVIASVISTDLDFPLLLLLFLVVSTFALLIDTTLAEGERLGARVRFEITREGSRSVPPLMRAALQVSLIAILGGVVVFLVFPRFGVGFFLRGELGDRSVSGFSDEVRLGDFGTIKSDSSTVMHLRLPPGVHAPKRLDWHLRGSAFDHYQDGLWSHGPDAERYPFERRFGYSIFHRRGEPWPVLIGPKAHPTRQASSRPLPGFAASEEAMLVTVTLEDIGSELLFAAEDPLAAGIVARGALEARNRLLAGVDRQIRVQDKQPGPIQYRFVSRLGQPTREELLALGLGQDQSATLEPYRQLPSQLSPEFHALARALTADKFSRIEKVESVLQHLARFQYSVKLESSPRHEAGYDPIEAFLFDTQSGHCEYFASAMALLLRAAGVPTRNVNGYYGAQLNELGGFYTVRQADAHSWVEVHFGPLGWLRFDPTPPSGRSANDQTLWWPALTEAFDALHHRYLDYVIDFDLGKQLALLENVGLRRSSKAPTFSLRTTLGVLIGVPLFFLGLRFFLRRRRGPRHPPVTAIYRSLLDALAKQGFERLPQESAFDFCRRIEAQGYPRADLLSRFARLYDSLRFAPDPEDVDARLGILRQLAASLSVPLSVPISKSPSHSDARS